MSRPSLPLDEQAFLLLSQAYAQSRKEVEKAIAGLHITIAEYTMLRIIENSPGITAGEARMRLFATAPSVAQLVGALEGKKLIKRQKSTEDTRRLHIHLTKEGERNVSDARKAILSMLRSMGLKDGVLRSLIEHLSLFLSSLPSHGTEAPSAHA